MPVNADAIPASVLQQPIIGEARRFDGAAAPALWMLAQGQTLQIKDNAALFGVLGTCAGGDGKTTFKLPAPANGWIVATAGIAMTSPSSIARVGRSMRHEDSLGEGARQPLMASPKPIPAELSAARQLLANQGPARTVGPVPLSADFAARIARGRYDSAAAAFSQLSGASRAQLGAAIADFTSARASLNDAVLRMTHVLSPGEATALLAISDTQSNALRDRPVAIAHARTQLEAARFLMSVAIAPNVMDEAIANGAR